MPWYNTSWSKRIKVTIDHTKVDATLPNFPVFIELGQSPASFFSTVRSDGGDIRVTKADGITEVPRQVLIIDTTAKTGSVFLRADSINASTDKDFYIYYGNASATDYAANATYGSQAVWSAYTAVFLARKVGGNYVDEVTGSTGTVTGTVTDHTGGQTGRYIEVNNSGINVITMPSITTSGDVTAYTLVNYLSTQIGNSGPVFAANFRSFGTGNNSLLWRLYNSYYQSAIQTLSFGDWHTTGFRTASGDGAYFYFDGAQADYTNTTDALRANTATYVIGGSGSNNQNMIGYVATVMIANQNLGAGWLTTQGVNLISPSTFYSLGSPESNGGSNPTNPAFLLMMM